MTNPLQTSSKNPISTMLSSTASTQPATDTTSAFARSVLHGLSQAPKQLSSMYFYDERGDQLFQDIMHMPEYYLMNCELNIFEQQKAQILEAIGLEHFHLLELGAGDGYKTRLLLRYFMEQSVDFEYQPIDISASVLQELELRLREELPALKVHPLPGDYFNVLHEVKETDTTPKVVLFLGANIGNYPQERAVAFLRHLQDELNTGDKLLVGFDLKKDPEVILNAYNDPAGITAAFNLNLLERMNRELGANFNIQDFRHWESYDPVTGATRSFLVSTKAQHVFIKTLNQSFHFEAWEAVNVELSQKYSLSEIEALAADSGFLVEQHFTDDRGYFVDSLWRKL
ncbi:MAG: L-histidine N(alpha)-methyltransferase [Phaeodactylibacter sp.]|uniref:L-histidine N(alpha)-methyltransferase n=1 Tax=Phaeodactylibacter sp. TaxID=1940289 RepID=UPI0032ED1BA7